MIPSFQKRLKYLDLYSKPPKSLTIPSFSGAVISISAIILTITLFLSELHIYNSFHFETSHEIKPFQLGKQLQLYLQINIDKIPCWAIQSNQREGGESWIFMTQIDNNPIQHIKHDPFKNETKSKELQEFINGKASGNGQGEWQGGCLVEIWQKIDMIPGTLQIGVRGDLESLILSKQFIIDMSHQIKEFRFGDHEIIQKVQNAFPNKLHLETLNNYDPWEYKGFLDKMLGVLTQRDRSNVFYEYYVTVIPSEFYTLKGDIFNTFEYAANTQQFKTQMGGLIDIKYDFSPNVVAYKEVEQSLDKFLVRVCGIIGGIFSVAGIIDAIIYSGIQKLVQKHQMNKLR